MTARLIDPKNLEKELALIEQINLESFCDDRDMGAFTVIMTIQHVWHEDNGHFTLSYHGREYDLTTGRWVE